MPLRAANRLGRLVALCVLLAVGASLPVIPPVRASAPATAIAWSPDNALLAVGSAAGVTLYRTSDWQPLADLRGTNDQTITALAWNPDGSRIAGGAGDGVVYLWPATGGDPLILRGPGKAIRALTWSPDGAALSAASGEAGVTLWETDSGQVRAVLMHDGPVFAVDWGGAGLAVGGALADTYERGFVRLWETRTGVPLRDYRDYRADMRPALRVQWRPGQPGPESARLGVLTRYQMFEWDTATDETLPIDMLLSDGVYSLTFDWSPSGTLFGGANYQSTQPEIGSLVFVRGDMPAGQFERSNLARRSMLSGRKVQALEFSGDDLHLAVLDDGGSLHILDSETARPLWSR